MNGQTTTPLVLHVLHRFDTGGLENGVVNLINHMPVSRFRHAVLALDRVEPAFAARLSRTDVQLYALNKQPGHAVKLYPRIWRLLRELRPSIVHTRNLAALEVLPVAAAAGVLVRIHGEHGRDIEDMDGTSKKQQLIRRFYSPWVHRYVTVSKELQGYLVDRVGIRAARVQQIYNGVETAHFCPAPDGRQVVDACPFQGPDLMVVGTVGRMQTVKNQTLLARSFVRALQLEPGAACNLRLVMVGGGPLREQAQRIIDEAGLGALAWLPGERSDVAQLMRSFDAYALPSLAEGVSNTILEAMASGLPVIATNVGGNPELVIDGVTGLLVASQDVEAMAHAMLQLLHEPQRAAAMRLAGRSLALQRYSLPAMVTAYAELYELALNR
jgi:sugar transferase (PEP-CTERM/EpsH1 system associated)